MIKGINKKDQFLNAIQYTVYLLIILYFGRTLFIPLSFALLISFILYPICTWLERHKLSKVISIFICLILFTLFFVGILWLLLYQFGEFMKEWPVLQVKVNRLIEDIDVWVANSYFNTFFDTNAGFLDSLLQYALNYLLPILPQSLYQSSVSLVLLVLVPVLSALILYYREVLTEFLYLIFPPSASEKIRIILPDVIVTYYNFVKGMALVYLIVGILNSIGLAIIGVPNPIFFGFIASVLTFIPYVGIAIGAVLPMSVSWLMYDSIYYPLGVVIVFGIVQILEAYIIFPLAVSYKLNVNALITLIVIIAGGILWGAMGMILFLPFVAILKLVADQVDELKPISVLLGSNDEKKSQA
jgi:predicted PurR-regulated permease PerM